jgi:hypothetical protein
MDHAKTRDKSAPGDERQILEPELADSPRDGALPALFTDFAGGMLRCEAERDKSSHRAGDCYEPSKGQLGYAIVAGRCVIVASGDHG